MGVGGLEPPQAQCLTDFKSGASTYSATLPSESQVGAWNAQYSLKVIFISLLVRLACFAALGKFHLAENSISMDFLVSGLI